MDHKRAAVVWQKGRRVGRTEGPFGPENSVINRDTEQQGFRSEVQK